MVEIRVPVIPEVQNVSDIVSDLEDALKNLRADINPGDIEDTIRGILERDYTLDQGQYLRSR